MAGSGAAATEGLLRCLYEGVISGCDTEIERRPYHKNCSCALHRAGKGCSRSNKNLNRKISYPMRKSWSEGCLPGRSRGTIGGGGGGGASPSSPSSSSSSPSAASNNNNNCFIRGGSSSSKLRKEVNFQIMYEKDEEEKEKDKF